MIHSLYNVHSLSQSGFVHPVHNQSTWLDLRKAKLYQAYLLQKSFCIRLPISSILSLTSQNPLSISGQRQDLTLVHVHNIIIWLALRSGKMNQTLHSGWLSFIDQACSVTMVE